MGKLEARDNRTSSNGSSEGVAHAAGARNDPRSSRAGTVMSGQARNALRALGHSLQREVAAFSPT